MKTSYLTALGALPASIVPKDRPGVFILFDQNHVWVQVYKHKLHWTRERVLHAIQCCRAEYERAYPNWRSLANPFFEDWWVGSSSKKKGKAVQYVAKKKPSVVKSGQKAVRSEDIVNQTEVFDLDCEELKADNVHDLDKKKYPNGWKVQPTSASHQNLFIKARRELKGK